MKARQEFLVGKLMPSLFQLCSRDIILRIQSPLMGQEVNYKLIEMELQSIAQVAGRKNSMQEQPQQLNEFIALSSGKDSRKSHLENIE